MSIFAGVWSVAQRLVNAIIGPKPAESVAAPPARQPEVALRAHEHAACKHSSPTSCAHVARITHIT